MTGGNNHLVIAFPHQAIGCNKETQCAKARPKPKWIANIGNITLDVRSKNEKWSLNARTSDLDKGRTRPTIKIQTTAAMRPHCSDPVGRASYLSERGRMCDARQNSSVIEIE